MALTKINLGNMVTGTLPDANIPNDITIDVSSAVPATFSLRFSFVISVTLTVGISRQSLVSIVLDS